MLRKVNACLDTFNEIEANGITMVTALNKIDLLEGEEIEERVQHLSSCCPIVVPISAEKRIGLERLLIVVEEELPKLQRYSIVLSYGDEGMSTLSWLYDSGNVESVQYIGNDIEVTVSLSNEIADKFSREKPDFKMTRMNR